MEGRRQSLISYRLRSVRVGVQATFLVLAALLAFMVIPSRNEFESEALYLGVLGVAAVGALVVAALPWSRLFARGWGMWAMYTWSVLDIVLITILILTTGGDESPLHLLFGLTTVFFSASYPPRAQVALLLFTLGCYFVAIQISEDHIVVATLIMRFSVLVSLTYITSFLARELIEQNAQLEATVDRYSTAEKRLRESEADLADAQRVARLGSWTWDLATNRITWSEELFRIYGLEADRQPGKLETLLKSIHVDDREAVRDAVEESLATSADLMIEFRIVRPDGETRIVVAEGRVESQAGAGPRMVGTVLDVTERKNAEAADRELHDLRVRQQQAVEINDSVVQGLAVASYALDAGDEQRAKAAISKTLASARSIVNQLLDVEALEPGDLVRSRSANVLTDGSDSADKAS